jgi:excisionase family DNA binding protein
VTRTPIKFFVEKKSKFSGPNTRRINNMSDILTAAEVAAMLKISKRQVYALAKESNNPIPSIRIRTSVRFRKVDVDGWIAGLVEGKAA